jgi:RND family efflux transporter MFP subunit
MGTALKNVLWLTLGLVLGCLLAQGHGAPQAPAAGKDAPGGGPRLALEVAGRTEVGPGRKGTIAPVPLHPVEQVFVAPGERVKKGQPLVRLDDDEPKADVRNKEAVLESARVALKEARRYLAAAEKAYATGALSEISYHAARTAALRADQDEKAAQAALDAAKAELEHYLVTAAIDGVVAWLDVTPGMVSRPGTTVWGEILDLREIDVRCELTPEQADHVSVGQPAEVGPAAGKGPYVPGHVAFVAVSADKTTGLVPVVVRVPNAEGRLRCGVPVKLRFGGSEAAAGG